MKRWISALIAAMLMAGMLSGCAVVKKTEVQSGPVAQTPAEQPKAAQAPAPQPAEEPVKPATKQSVVAPVQPKAALAEKLKNSATPAAPGPSASGLAFTLPDKAYRGEPFIFAAQAKGLEKAAVTWEGKTVTIKAGQDGQLENRCETLLAVSLGEKAKSLPLSVVLTINGQETGFSAAVPTARREYPVQKLSVDPKFVTPPAEELPRIERERKQLAAVTSQISPVKYWGLPMKRPVPGVVTSLYGLRRVFNGQERGSHRGLDLDGKTGEPIYACDTGKVALVGDFYYSGQIAVIDHGLGVFTLYLHMSAFNVAEGQMVKRGDVVGYVGATGRVTGPHLHLSLNVLRNSVNPNTFLEKQFKAE